MLLQCFDNQIVTMSLFAYSPRAEKGAPDKPCGVGCADVNPKLLLNDT